MIDFLDWVARAGGIITVLVAVLGFLFREKWKQMLQRSLAEDLERLKSELAMSQAEHAASLTPQLEQIKHDFQQKLEAYKVSLIAETEAVKAKGELRKSIALRYAEIEFERLVKLEHVMSPLATDVLALAAVDVQHKTEEHSDQAVEKIQALTRVTEEADMFISRELGIQLLDFRAKVILLIQQHIGHGKPALTLGDQLANELMAATSELHGKLKERIKALGSL